MAPQIAALFGLKPADLYWALEHLEGRLIETVTTKRGKFRDIRLLPEWEHRESASAAAQEEFKQGLPPQDPLDGERIQIDRDSVLSEIHDFTGGYEPDILMALKELARPMNDNELAVSNLDLLLETHGWVEGDERPQLHVDFVNHRWRRSGR